uniref:Uncharacterized protein n=1 Tax=Panagrolaimus davidi TaxID=227884 RepID=A0A914PD34_9BILA
MKFFAVLFLALFVIGAFVSDAAPPLNACTETCFNGGSVTECCRAHGYRYGGRCSDDGVNGKRAYCNTFGK